MTRDSVEAHVQMILEHIANIEMYSHRVRDDADHYSRLICAETLAIAGHARELRAAARTIAAA